MLVSRSRKRFGKNVGNVVRSGDVMELDASSGLFVVGVVILHYDVCWL